MGLMIIDTDKAFKMLNEQIQQHDQMAYESGLNKELENNQIPGWWWKTIIEYSSASFMELTNGDIIKDLYANCSYFQVGEIVTVVLDENTIEFKADWWNAPYKGVEHGTEVN